MLTRLPSTLRSRIGRVELLRTSHVTTSSFSKMDNPRKSVPPILSGYLTAS